MLICRGKDVAHIGKLVRINKRMILSKLLDGNVLLNPGLQFSLELWVNYFLLDIWR